MRTTTLVTFFLSAVVFGVIGCTTEGSPSARRERELAAAEPSATSAVAPTSEPTVAIDPRTVPSPPEPTNAQAVMPVSNPDQERLREVLEAMAAAQAQAAEADGQSTCQQAFNSTVRFAAALRESLGVQTPPENVPDEAEFVRACNALPPNVQQCMVMAYSVSHQAECSAVRRDMAPEIRESVRELTKMLGPARREE